jgi:hypothetical protein
MLGGFLKDGANHFGEIENDLLGSKRAKVSVGCGVVYIVIGALENVLDESG